MTSSPYFHVLRSDPPDGTAQIIVTRGDDTFTPIAACHDQWAAVIVRALNGHGGPFPDHP